MKRNTGFINSTSLARFARASLAGLLVVTTAACGGGDKPSPKTGADGKGGGGGNKPAELSKDAQAKFNAALDLMIEHDKKNDWNNEACADVAKKFDEVGRNAPAAFNAGLAYQRCNDDKNAKAKFEAALQADPKFHHARAQIALYQYLSLIHI